MIAKLIAKIGWVLQDGGIEIGLGDEMNELHGGRDR